METSNWPPSNYPIFLALVLLVATAVTLAMGDEARAEDLAVYTYYLLVIGVAIRFLEISLPDDTLEKITAAANRVSVSVSRLSAWGSRSASNSAIFKNIRELKPSKEHKSTAIPKMKQVASRSNLMFIKKISKEVSIYLGLLVIIMYVYGYMFGWWIVWGYMEKLFLIVITFSSLYLLLSIFIRHSNEN